MTTTQRTAPRETVLELYAAFARGDIPFILERIDADAQWGVSHDEPLLALAPHLRRGVGRAAALAYFQGVGASMEVHGLTPRVLAAEGPDVLVLLDLDFTARPTGKRVSVREVHHFRVRDGRIVEYEPLVPPAWFRAFELP